MRYDAARQVVGTIEPDPDGGGSLKHRAVRTTFRPDGLPSKQELGSVNSQSDVDWTAFAPLETVDVTYDANARPTSSKLSGGATAYALTQTSYDALGRPNCSATRMNPAIYGSLPASACTLGTAGTNGADRISQNVYDADGRAIQLKVAVGTADAATERTLTYTNNDQPQTLTDAENNKTSYVYDGHDRLSQTQYPSAAKGAGTSNAADYEQLGYDAGGNVISRRLRDATSIAFTFDTLNRPTLKNLPGSEPDVTYGYDNLGRLASASQTGSSLSFTYDALGRNLTQVGPQGTVTSQWDAAGRRTQLTYPGTGLAVNNDYLVTGEVQKIRENGATSGVGVLATYAYDTLRRRTGVTFGNGVAQAFAYDPVSRLASLSNDLASTANDLSATFGYNPASQIASTVRTGDAYAWTEHVNGTKAGTANGLNQLTAVGAKSLSHDSKGNVTAFGTKGFTYSSENLLLTGPSSTSLSYDPLMRLQQVTSSSATRLAYDGLDRIAEYDAADALLRRYVHGPGADQPIVWYEGADTSDRRFLSADERGSIISVTDSAGALLGINRYDEFGQPQSTNLGAFGYTGQAWLPSMGMWYYKAREMDPELGRFLQPDPIGYADSPNPYQYVLNDPINFSDPLGLSTGDQSVFVTACRNGGQMPLCLPKAFNIIWGDLGEFFGAHGGIGGSGGGGGQGSGNEGQEQKDREACELGNKLARVSAKAASAGTAITGVGLGITAFGAITAQPEIVGAGAATVTVGSGLGIVAGTAQMGAGLLQGWGGAGYSNFWKGSVTLLSSYGLGRVIAGPGANGYRTVSQRQTDRFLSDAGRNTGGLYDVTTSAIPNLGANEVVCQ